MDLTKLRSAISDALPDDLQYRKALEAAFCLADPARCAGPPKTPQTGGSQKTVRAKARQKKLA